MSFHVTMKLVRKKNGGRKRLSRGGFLIDLKETLGCFIFIIKTGAYWLVKGFLAANSVYFQSCTKPFCPSDKAPACVQSLQPVGVQGQARKSE